MAKRRPSGDGMVRKREDGRWEGRIVVGHKQNGEPIFRYVLAKTQKGLLDKLHRDLEAFQDVELTEDSRMTLGEWLDRWMEDYGAATLRPNTLRSYEQFIRCYIKPYLGDKIVSRGTRMDIQKLYRKLKHEGRVREHPEYGHELSDTMVLRIHAMLHRCLKNAEAAHVIARNPTDGAVVPKASYKPKQVLTREQMETFLTAVDRNEIWRDFFYTELTTGLRRGEICGLMWQDFDEKAGTLKILRSVNVPKAGELEIGETKTSQGRRTIRLPPSTVQRLKERKKHAVSQWIFPEPLAPEKPVRPSAAYYWMKRILKEAGLPAIRFHDLRHPYVKHTTKIFSLRLMDFQAQAYPDARRKTRGACQLLRVGQSRSPVRPLCNRKRFSCLPPQSKMSWILYAISMRLSGYTSTQSISSSASSVVSVSASKIALDASLRLSCRACSSCFFFACANTAA